MFRGRGVYYPALIMRIGVMVCCLHCPLFVLNPHLDRVQWAYFLNLCVCAISGCTRNILEYNGPAITTRKTSTLFPQNIILFSPIPPRFTHSEGNLSGTICEPVTVIYRLNSSSTNRLLARRSTTHSQPSTMARGRLFYKRTVVAVLWLPWATVLLEHGNSIILHSNIAPIAFSDP